MDDRERRQRRDEFEVDEALGFDVPLWYLQLTARLRSSWRRDVLSVLAVGGLCGAVGFLLGRLGG